MPSRTYIQMLLKLHNNGKLPLCEELLDNLIKYNAVLEKHPEAIEEVVQRRVYLVKYVKKSFSQCDVSPTSLHYIGAMHFRFHVYGRTY